MSVGWQSDGDGQEARQLVSTTSTNLSSTSGSVASAGLELTGGSEIQVQEVPDPCRLDEDCLPDAARPETALSDHGQPVASSSSSQTTTTSMNTEVKIINDLVHENIELHPLLVAIIDTPQFQRLRNIKQLPGAYWVYPGAAHNRFEHSIGVAHLAGKQLKSLRKKQPELRINDEDILCVQVAGLCHDLGIGPFSYVYGNKFLGIKGWKHEEISVDMFEHMLQSNVELKKQFTNYKLHEQHMAFIKQQIKGDIAPCDVYADKKFLYQIIGKRRTGLDVDAWDYYLRDSYHLGIKTAFDHKRLMLFTRVENDPETGDVLCVRDKEVDSIYSEFTTRLMHNRNAIQHKVSVSVKLMLADAMKLADDHIQVKGSGGRVFKMSTAFQDMEAYTRLDDSVYHKILHSRTPELQEARHILERIESRQLYRLADQTKPLFDVRDPADLAQKYTESFKQKFGVGVVAVHVCTFNYGQRRNPLDDVRVFTKVNRAICLARQASQGGDSILRPRKNEECVVRIYCTRRDEATMKEVRDFFAKDDCFKHNIVQRNSDATNVSYG